MKTVLITGAAGGLGKALANIFMCNNYRTILHCFKTEINSPLLQIIKGDLLLPKTIKKLGKSDIDILINNAAIRICKPFAELSEDEIRKSIDTNLIAPMLLTKALWPILNKNRGLVINVNSLAGKQGSRGETAYCASKFGLRGFSQGLQFDAVKDNVKVIDVFIGAMRTEMTKERDDQDKLISPKEAAQVIYNFCLCENYNTLRITEIEIKRGIY